MNLAFLNIVLIGALGIEPPDAPLRQPGKWVTYIVTHPIPVQGKKGVYINHPVFLSSRELATFKVFHTVQEMCKTDPDLSACYKDWETIPAAEPAKENEFDFLGKYEGVSQWVRYNQPSFCASLEKHLTRPVLINCDQAWEFFKYQKEKERARAKDRI